MSIIVEMVNIQAIDNDMESSRKWKSLHWWLYVEAKNLIARLHDFLLCAQAAHSGCFRKSSTHCLC